MQFLSIPKTFTRDTIRISQAYPENAKNTFLYNQAMDIKEKFHIPATVSSKGIDFPNVPVEVKDALNQVGIKFKVLV